MKRNKKKTAEILSEIDSNLDKVLSILSKPSLVAMSIKTIIEILTTLQKLLKRFPREHKLFGKVF